MIKVLETESSKGWGGQEKRTVRLAKALEEHGVQSIFAAQPDSHLFLNQNTLGIKVYPVKMGSTLDISAVFKLAGIIKKEQIGIVSTHSGRDGYLGGFAARLCGAKVVRTRHLQTPFKRGFSYRYLADKVVCVSRAVAEYVVSRGIDADKVEVVYTGIDTENFSHKTSTLKTELGLPDDTLLIGTVAVLRAAKRHADLIEAFLLLKDSFPVKLVIAGDGPQRQNLEKLIAAKNLQNDVFLLGHRGDTVNVLNGLDIFVFASEMEALGTALLEAISCELPAVASNVGGIPECFVDKEGGLLFEPKNITDMMGKIKLLIENSEKRAEMGKNGRGFVVKNFSNTQMAEKTLKIYENMVLN